MRKLALRRGSSEPSFLGLNVDMIRNGYLPKAVDADVLASDSRSLEEQMASVGLYDMDNHCPRYLTIWDIQTEQSSVISM